MPGMFPAKLHTPIIRAEYLNNTRRRIQPALLDWPSLIVNHVHLLKAYTCGTISSLFECVRKVRHLLKEHWLRQVFRSTTIKTRSSAQGNYSAKSLAASVMSSILPCSSILPGPPCPPPVIQSLCVCVCGVWPWGGLATGSGRRGGLAGGGGVPQGGGGSHRGEGAGDILVQLPYTALPHGASP